MAIKDILVHVETSVPGRARTELAIRLARRFAARLTGLFVVPPAEPFVPMEGGAFAAAIAATAVQLDRTVKDIERQFRHQLRRVELSGDWHVASGAAELEIARRAGVTDLVVIGQHDPDHPGMLTGPQDVVLSCGRPVLLVPYAGSFLNAGMRTLVAWNASREASRALHDALAVMAPETIVTVLTIETDAGMPSPSGEEVVEHLAHHRIQAEAETANPKGLSPSEALLSRAADLDCDLIVMGAYGHSPIRELILGGMTRDILRHMTLPVLMAR